MTNLEKTTGRLNRGEHDGETVHDRELYDRLSDDHARDEVVAGLNAGQERPAAAGRPRFV
jgi:hypothetical protein